MPRDRTELDTPRLTLLAYPPEHILGLIEDPERFEEQFALTPADGLRGFYVSGEVSPQWLEALRNCVGQRSEEHTSELQSHSDLVCRLLLEKKKKQTQHTA